MRRRPNDHTERLQDAIMYAILDEASQIGGITDLQALDPQGYARPEQRREFFLLALSLAFDVEIDPSSEIMCNLVTYAREAGAEWQHIGGALGMTKQSAHSRYTRSRDRRWRGKRWIVEPGASLRYGPDTPITGRRD